jgi:DUF4097 and DUF4098 domain-containing protein YvlB
MPTFDTPESVNVNVELGVGHVRIVAGERGDTVVDVRPSDEGDESDVKAAQQVRVDYANGTLRVTGPKSGAFDFSRKTRSVDLSIELPAGSQVSATVQLGDLRCAGRLGPTRLKTSAGHVSVEHTGPLHADTGAGQVTVGGVTGDAEIHTGSGTIQIGTVEGGAVLKNSNGDTAIDSVGGDLRVRNANGRIRVERAGAGVDAKTSNGAIHLGEVAQGTVVLDSGMGDLYIGIADGTAAWLDINTGFGKVHNRMTGAAQPDATDRTVEVRGRTGYGDVTIERT